MPLLHIDKRSDIPRAIAAMQQAGAGHRVPLLQALYRGRIALLEAQRNSSSKLFKCWTAAACMPAAALIGDDDHANLDGPDTWPVAQRMFRWARFVLIHGGGGRPEHYEHAVQLTEACGRLVMVECSSANVEAWRDAAARWAANAQGEVMQPPPGLPHPSLDKGHVQ